MSQIFSWQFKNEYWKSFSWFLKITFFCFFLFLLIFEKRNSVSNFFENISKSIVVSKNNKQKKHKNNKESVIPLKMEKKNCSVSFSWKMKKKTLQCQQKRVKPRNLLFLIFSLLLVVQKCGRVCISESGQAQSVIGFAFFHLRSSPTFPSNFPTKIQKKHCRVNIFLQKPKKLKKRKPEKSEKLLETSS